MVGGVALGLTSSSAYRSKVGTGSNEVWPPGLLATHAQVMWLACLRGPSGRAWEHGIDPAVPE